MKIVIDTNVLISGVFFGGNPEKVLRAAVNRQDVTACVTPEIADEYQEIVREMINRKQGHLNKDILAPLIGAMEFVVPVSKVEVCRDPDDDKFLACALDAVAYYIVSGDADLLVIENFENIKIITAKDFCERFLDK